MRHSISPLHQTLGIALLLVGLLLAGCRLAPPQPPATLSLYAPPAPETTLAGIGPDQPYRAAPCDRTLNAGEPIQPAIDAVRDHVTPYVLCLQPGYYVGGMAGDTTVDPNHDFGDTVVGPEAGGDWWNQNDDGPYYGNIVIKNRRNFTLRGLVNGAERAVILGLPNDELYPPEAAAAVDQHPNDKGLLIKVVNGDNIVIENLTIDGFSYPDFPQLVRKVSVLNRLIWLQNTANTRIVGNIVRNAGGECIRLRSGSHDNEIAYNTIHGCGYYQFKIQPLHRLWKNGEGIYIGVDPYQIRASQINKQAYWGANWEAGTDGSHNNLIHHNDIFPGDPATITPPPINQLRAGVLPSDGYGNECVDVKEELETIGRMVTFSADTTSPPDPLSSLARGELNSSLQAGEGLGVRSITATAEFDANLPATPPQLINNVIRDNRCQGQADEDSGALDARSSNNLFAHNLVTGTVRGAALRLGGGEPKPVLVEPLLSNPTTGCTGTIVETYKWQAYNNRIRNNIFASYYNDFSDFNGRGGYLASDCDDEVACPAPGQPEFIEHNCGEQKILYVVKTFAVAGYPMEAQATGSGVCGNTVDGAGSLDWGRRLYKGKQQPVLFSRLPAAATNLPTCVADANNPAAPDPPGPHGCVGASCVQAEGR